MLFVCNHEREEGSARKRVTQGALVCECGWLVCVHVIILSPWMWVSHISGLDLSAQILYKRQGDIQCYLAHEYADIGVRGGRVCVEGLKRNGCTFARCA